MKVIKRYSNRKLYDIQAGHYVTLEDLRQLIRAGEEIQVVDHVSGADLTTVTMFQILFEQEKQLGGMVPQVMLKRMIQNGSLYLSPLREGLRAFLNPMQSAEDEMRRRMQTLVEKGRLTESERERLEKLFFASEEPKAEEAHSPEPVPDEQAADSQELEALLQKVQELEKQLGELKK